MILTAATLPCSLLLRLNAAAITFSSPNGIRTRLITLATLKLQQPPATKTKILIGSLNGSRRLM